MLKKFVVFALSVILLAACTALQPAAPVLDGTAWNLLQLNGQPVVEGTMPTLTFHEGQAGGNSSCNSYGAEYTQQGKSLTFAPIVTTLMACLDAGIMQQESAMYAALQTVKTYQLEQDTLTLLDADGSAVLVFTRSE